MFDITLTFDDGTTEALRPLPIDFTVWERETGRQLSDLAEGVGMTDLAWLAYSAATRSKAPVHRDDDGKRLPFRIWLERVADLDFDELDESEVGPTPPGPRPG